MKKCVSVYAWKRMGKLKREKKEKHKRNWRKKKSWVHHHKQDVSLPHTDILTLLPSPLQLTVFQRLFSWILCFNQGWPIAHDIFFFFFVYDSRKALFFMCKLWKGLVEKWHCSETNKHNSYPYRFTTTRHIYISLRHLEKISFHLMETTLRDDKKPKSGVVGGGRLESCRYVWVAWKLHYWLILLLFF